MDGQGHWSPTLSTSGQPGATVGRDSTGVGGGTKRHRVLYEKMGGRCAHDGELSVWGRVNPVMALELTSRARRASDETGPFTWASVLAAEKNSVLGGAATLLRR